MQTTGEKLCALPSNRDVCRALDGGDPVLRMSIQVGPGSCIARLQLGRLVPVALVFKHSECRTLAS